MPFRSDKQRRWMFSNKPALARKWANENRGRNKGNSKKRNRRRKKR